MMKPKKTGRPLDRLPEPYRSRVLSTLNIIALDGMAVSEATEEHAVRDMENSLVNGEAERYRELALRCSESMRRAGIPFVKVRNPLPPW